MAINLFQESKSELPSWGPDVDKDISRDVSGFESRMSSPFYCFMAERHFWARCSRTRLLGAFGLTCKPVFVFLLLGLALMTSEHCSRHERISVASNFACQNFGNWPLLLNTLQLQLHVCEIDL